MFLLAHKNANANSTQEQTLSAGQNTRYATPHFGYSILRLKLLGVSLTGSAKVTATASHSSGARHTTGSHLVLAH
jgi:hypothetical protein